MTWAAKNTRPGDQPFRTATRVVDRKYLTDHAKGHLSCIGPSSVVRFCEICPICATRSCTGGHGTTRQEDHDREELEELYHAKDTQKFYICNVFLRENLNCQISRCSPSLQSVIREFDRPVTRKNRDITKKITKIQHK